MKKIISLLIISICFGCIQKDPNDYGLPYFKFQNEDNAKLITSLEPNKILIYKDQNNNEMIFKVLKSQISKQLYSRGNWVYGSTEYFYYDEQRFEMTPDLSEVEIPFNQDDRFYISLKRWPIQFNDGSDGNPRIIGKESQFITNIGLVPFSGIYQNTELDYNRPIQNLTINGFTYTKVRVIEIPVNPYASPNWELSDMHYIYFDQNNGVIGFDDYEGNQWRLQNSN